MMYSNTPSFLITYWAISQVGAVPALINYNLRAEPLLHCIRIAKCSAFLFEPQYVEQVDEIADALQNELNLNPIAYDEFELSTSSSYERINQELLVQKGYTDADTDESLLALEEPSEAAVLVYTSGTTGMPKVRKPKTAGKKSYICINAAYLAIFLCVGCHQFASSAQPYVLLSQILSTM